MSISGQISQEARFFLISVLAGAAFLFGYGLIRGVRREFPAGRIRTGLEDFFYWACAGAVFFLITFLENSGMVRGFSLAGMCFGMFLYYKMLDRLVVAVFAEILHILFYPIRFMTKKTGTFFFFLLKMCKKKVTMSISKAKGKQTGRVKNEKKKKTQK